MCLLSVCKFPNKLAPELLNNIPRNSPFLFYSFIFIVSLTPFVNKPHSSSDWTILIISFIFSYEIISVASHEAKSEQRKAKSEEQNLIQNILLAKTLSVADADAVIRNGISYWFNSLMV